MDRRSFFRSAGAVLGTTALKPIVALATIPSQAEDDYGSECGLMFTGDFMSDLECGPEAGH